jgi:transcriptional regulator NrdR family protein
MTRPVKHDGAARDGEATGLVCRACGCRHFRVIYLKRLPGALLRRRECRHCGKRLTTRETAR